MSPTRMQFSTTGLIKQLVYHLCPCQPPTAQSSQKPAPSPFFVFPPHFIALCSRDTGASLEFSRFSLTWPPSVHVLRRSMLSSANLTPDSLIHSLQPRNWRGQKEVWFLWSRFEGEFHHVWEIYLYSQLLFIGDFTGAEASHCILELSP